MAPSPPPRRPFPRNTRSISANLSWPVDRIDEPGSVARQWAGADGSINSAVARFDGSSVDAHFEGVALDGSPLPRVELQWGVQGAACEPLTFSVDARPATEGEALEAFQSRVAGCPGEPTFRLLADMAPSAKMKR
jgi:hypothetical protein